MLSRRDRLGGDWPFFYLIEILSHDCGSDDSDGYPEGYEGPYPKAGECELALALSGGVPSEYVIAMNMPFDQGMACAKFKVKQIRQMKKDLPGNLTSLQPTETHHKGVTTRTRRISEDDFFKGRL